MTVAAQDIILDVQTELQDLAGIRWPATELVRYLKEAQRVIATKRPDQTATQATFTLAAGERQQLPAAAAALIDIPRNSTGVKKAITKTDQFVLEAVEPDWRSQTPASEIVHFMHDMREPRTFVVYPPAVAGAQVELIYGAYPTSAVAAGGATAATVTGDLTLADQWQEAIRYYVTYRAWSKDAESGGNSTLAGQNYQLFKAELGEQIEGSAAVSPKE